MKTGAKNFQSLALMLIMCLSMCLIFQNVVLANSVNETSWGSGTGEETPDTTDENIFNQDSILIINESFSINSGGNAAITVKDGATLTIILKDTATLTLRGRQGVAVESGSTLNILGGGKINATGLTGAGIGGEGIVNIFSGEIITVSKGNGAGMGGNPNENGTVNIYGGTIDAISEGYGAGIGGGMGGSGTVKIYGGYIESEGFEGGAGIGGGSGADGTVCIYAADIYAISYDGAGVGGGMYGAGYVKLAAGVMVQGSGVGDGYGGSGGNVEIGILAYEMELTHSLGGALYGGERYPQGEEITIVALPFVSHAYGSVVSNDIENLNEEKANAMAFIKFTLPEDNIPVHVIFDTTIEVSGVEPQNGAVNIEPSGTIKIEFTHNIVTQGKVVLKDAVTDIAIPLGNTNIDKNVCTVSYSGLGDNTYYQIVISEFKSAYDEEMVINASNFFTTKTGSSNTVSSGSGGEGLGLTLIINGVRVNYLFVNDGIKVARVIPTQKQFSDLIKTVAENGMLDLPITKKQGENGYIPNLANGEIEVDLEKLLDEAGDDFKGISFSVNGKEIILNTQVVQKLKEISKIVRFGISDDNMKFYIRNSQGKDMNYHSYSNPIYIKMPCILPQDINTNYLVMQDKGENEYIIPRSYYKNGAVYAISYKSSGSINTKYVDEEGFSDVFTHWGRTAINYMSVRDIIKGMGNNTFAPEETVTRAHYITMLMRTFDIDLEHEYALAFFNDYEETLSWAREYALAAKYLGISIVDENGYFRGNEPVSREEMFLYTFEIMGICNMLEKETDALDVEFSDWQDVGSQMEDEIQILAKLSLINGNGDGTLKPKEFSSRAEAAQFLYNVLRFEV